MFKLNKLRPAPRFFRGGFLFGVLALSSLACVAPFLPTEATPLPAQPTLPPASQVDTAPAAEVQPETDTEVSANTTIIGFWKSKVVTKQVLIFEFREDGQTIWHYHLNNGQKKQITGGYSLEGNILSVNIDTPQDLTVQINGDTLILTEPDGKTITFHRVANLDDPGPTASTNLPQDIVNRWQDTAVQEWLEFKADGTLTITSNENSVSGTYTITENNVEIKLENQESSSTFRVEIDGNVLTLYAQDGSFTDYLL